MVKCISSFEFSSISHLFIFLNFDCLSSENLFELYLLYSILVSFLVSGYKDNLLYCLTLFLRKIYTSIRII